MSSRVTTVLFDCPRRSAKGAHSKGHGTHSQTVHFTSHTHQSLKSFSSVILTHPAPIFCTLSVPPLHEDENITVITSLNFFFNLLFEPTPTNHTIYLPRVHFLLFL